MAYGKNEGRIRGIRGGRFVAGFTGEQFARPEALDLLRALRRVGDPPEVTGIPNADPLNLTGIILPGARVSPLAAAIPSMTAKPDDAAPPKYRWQRHVVNVKDSIA